MGATAMTSRTAWQHYRPPHDGHIHRGARPSTSASVYRTSSTRPVERPASAAYAHRPQSASVRRRNDAPRADPRLISDPVLADPRLMSFHEVARHSEDKRREAESRRQYSELETPTVAASTPAVSDFPDVPDAPAGAVHAFESSGAGHRGNIYDHDLRGYLSKGEPTKKFWLLNEVTEYHHLINKLAKENAQLQQQLAEQQAAELRFLKTTLDDADQETSSWPRGY